MPYKRISRKKEEIEYSDPMYRRLQTLEDKIERGELIELPCKIGDKVYQTDTNGTRIYCHTIKNIVIGKSLIVYDTDGICFDKHAIGQSVFLTKEEVDAYIENLGTENKIYRRQRRNEL